MAFEEYVHDNLGLKTGVATLPVTGNLPPNKMLQTTGVGMVVEAVDVPTPPAGGGAAYVTNITPQSTGNVGNKVYDASGVVLASCTSDTLAVRVTIWALTGPSHYKPIVTVNSITATLSAGTDAGTWTGYADVTLTGSQTVTVVHEDGAESTCAVTVQAAPEVVSAVFGGGYPGSQTELKSGDTFSMTVTSDVEMTGIDIQNYGACTAQTFDFTATTSKVITVVIADRGVTVQTLAAQLRVHDANGSYGSLYLTSAAGSVDGVNVVKLNNVYPTITIGAVSYPASQGALKNSETADVAMTYANADTVAFTSPNSDLSIANPSTAEAAKTCTRIGGSYNIATTNFRCVGNRAANNATTTSNGVVKIANVACTLAVTEPAARLRSGGNVGTAAQNHTITITASQNLYSAPTLVAPAGTWQGGGFTGATTTWTRSLQIHDDDTKGVQSWGAISATNLAGLTTTAITGDAQYTVGGFVFRTMTIAAWTNREGSIGTQVADTSKLRCTNLSKGASGSLNFTFQATTSDLINYYTITQPTGVYNATGNLWYNCDLANAVSNTSGTMQIELEEII